MPGRAKSDTKKVQLEQKAHDDLMAQAVAAYCTELKKPLRLKKQGARTICKDFECLNEQATGKDIKLSYSTLIRLAAGGKQGHSPMQKDAGCRMQKLMSLSHSLARLQIRDFH